MPSFQQFAASLIDSMLVLKNLSKRIQNEQDKKNQTNRLRKTYRTRKIRNFQKL